MNFSCCNPSYWCCNCCKNNNSGDRTDNVQVESALQSVTTRQPTPYPSRYSFTRNSYESTDTKVGIQVNEANSDNNQMNLSTRSTTISSSSSSSDTTGDISPSFFFIIPHPQTIV